MSDCDGFCGAVEGGVLVAIALGKVGAVIMLLLDAENCVLLVIFTSVAA